MALSDYLVTDDLTIILALVAAGLFLLHNLYKPQALVHPILLGRQSDVARVRNPTESAVYRNYGTGMLGRFPLRPTKDQHVLLDLVNPDNDAPRTLWSSKTTNPELRTRVANVGAGLVQLAGLSPQESNVLLLLDDGLEFVIADLALASHSIPSFTLSSLSLLSPVLDSHPPSAIITQASLLPQLLEHIYDSNESNHHTIVVVGDIDSLNLPRLNNVKIMRWEDLERQGTSIEKVTLPTPDPNDVFTVAFYKTPSGALEGVQLTHQNLTAGVAATRALMPPSSPISPLDTIVSAHPLSSPYGRAIAYTALFEGTSFATVDSTKLVGTEDVHTMDGLKDLSTTAAYRISSPTILFVRPAHLKSLCDNILHQATKSSWILTNLAWRHKLSGILEGYITKQSLWDRLVYDSARVKVMGKGAGTVRAVVVSGEPLDAHALTPARIALSVPIINAHSHPRCPSPYPDAASAPASDAYAFMYIAPVGPPLEAGSNPVGELHVRGPSVGRPLSVEVEPEEEELRGWRSTGERAIVAPNGSFKITVRHKTT
ncbi:hypothetical protein ONZ51_g6581 [Trametes cubensis]|uniref:AMP-dependent synthetase/ligase domain-containing protein n=1 Tax=Trametes cubensis TaxID=1111947 RepID=A0AAD7TTX3_9APHY|nr:hypothetical protein ONZ51_g6581 [Trametes cubensis]